MRYFLESTSFEIGSRYERRVFVGNFNTVATGIGKTSEEATARAQRIADLLNAFEMETSPAALRATFDAGQDAEEEMERLAGYREAMKRLDSGDTSAEVERLLLSCDERSKALGFGPLPISVRWPIILRRLRARRTT